MTDASTTSPNFGNRPLGALQRNWFNFLRHNPGPNYMALTQRNMRIALSLEARGLINLTPTKLKDDKDIPVFILEAKWLATEA